MKTKHGPKALAVLNYLLKQGDKNRLELERELGFGDLSPVVSDLRSSGYIASIPKVRKEMVRYKITAKGKDIIWSEIQRQESLRHRPISELAPYVPKDMPVRPGSMRAYQLPSKGMV